MTKIKTAVPLPTIKRLPLYIPILQEAKNSGQIDISSSYISGKLKLEAIQVRKDLAGIGIAGQPRVGFPVIELIEAITNFLGWNNTTDAFIIGAGHLGTALAGYKGFAENGLNIVAAFDIDKNKIDKEINQKKIYHIDRLANLAERLHIHIGILAVPVGAAQKCAQLMVEAGIIAIWNFTPAKIHVPENIIVERIDLAASFAVLSSKLSATMKKF
jgi:redox-sensing transcriptional repressor